MKGVEERFEELSNLMAGKIQAEVLMNMVVILLMALIRILMDRSILGIDSMTFLVDNVKQSFIRASKNLYNS